MNKEEMIKIILAYANELNDNYQDFSDVLGNLDEATTRAFSRWFVIDELIERLKLKK